MNCSCSLPFFLGPPQLMMALTKDGQLNPALAKERKEAEGIDIDTKREERKDFPKYTPRPEADGWENGNAWQIKPEKVDMKK